MKKRIKTSPALFYFSWIFFLIWPFGMLLLSIKNFSSKNYRIFVLLFFVFFGFTFVIKRSGADAYKHKVKFEEVVGKPFSELSTILSDFVHLEGEELDVYVPIANFVVSRFTDDVAYAFALHAFLFGLFYLKSISFIYDEFKGKLDRNSLLFLIMFITLFSIHQINAVRYYTAVWIWIYGALRLLSSRKLPFILICFSASLVHFGITTATLVLLIFYILGPQNKIYFPLLMVSFVAGTFFQLDKLVELGSAINETAEARAKMYTNEIANETKEGQLMQTDWFVLLRVYMLHYYLLFALAYVYVRKKDYKWDKQQEYLLSFLMLYLSFVNFVINVPSFGGRMRFIFWAMTAYFFFRFFRLNKLKGISVLVVTGAFPILLWAAVEFRISLEFTNTIAVFGNTVLAFIGNSNTSMYDFLYK